MIKLAIIILLIIVIVFLLFKTHFENSENFNNYHVDIVDRITNEEVNILIDYVLEYINKNFEKNLVRGNLEFVEKTYSNENINYSIIIFIYDSVKSTNKKLNFDITLDKDLKIILNNISIGNSRNILIEERESFPSRNSIIYPPSKINFNILKKNSINNNFAKVDFSETKNKMVNRTKDILPLQAQKYKNKKDYPSKIVFSNWDSNGVQKQGNDGCGSNYSTKKRDVTPNFYIHNFHHKLQNNNDYDWLFDLNSDSSSRPIGITGARGTS